MPGDGSYAPGERGEEHHKSYQWVQNNGRGYLQLPGLNHANVFHLFGTRLLPAEELENRYKPTRLLQVHGDHVQPVPKAQISALIGGIEGDALVTDVPNRFISVNTADCVPILLFDPVKNVAAAIHAGWRGTVLNIAGKTIRKMTLLYGVQPGSLLAGIGPAIHACCFEVGPDVVSAVEMQTPYGDQVFHQEAEKEEKGKWQLDLIKLNHLQLMDAGLPPNQIADSGLCTHCLPNLFYSFRRDREKRGSMISGIMLL